MSQVRKIAHNTIAQIIGKAVSVLLGLVGVAIMTRALGVEKFGWYATAVGFLQFIGILTDFGFTVAATNMLSEPAFDKNRVFGTVFGWRLVTAIITQGLLPLTIFFFPYPPEIKWAVVIMSLSFIGVSLNQIFIAHLQTQLRLVIQIIGEVVGRIVLVVGLALVAFYGLGFLPMMVAITLGSFAYTGYLWFKRGIFPIIFDKEIGRAMLTKIWPLALAVIFNAIYLQGDRFILPLYVSQSEVGLYGAAYRVIDIVAQIAAMLAGMMLPLITFAWSRGLRDDYKKQVQRALDLLALILLPIIAGLFVLAKPAMIFVAGANFAQSGTILRYLVFTLLGISLGSVFGYVNTALNRQKSVLWVYISCAVISAIGYFLFIPRFGIWGAAGVRIFSELYAGLCLTAMAIHFSGCWPRFRTYGKIAFAAVVMALLVSYTQPMNIFLSAALGGAVYFILILALRVVSRNTWQEIFRRGNDLPV